MSEIARNGIAAATSETKSPPPSATKVATRVCAVARIMVSSCPMARGVNADPTRLRYAVCTGGSIEMRI